MISLSAIRHFKTFEYKVYSGGYPFDKEFIIQAMSYQDAFDSYRRFIIDNGFAGELKKDIIYTVRKCNNELGYKHFLFNGVEHIVEF